MSTWLNVTLSVVTVVVAAGIGMLLRRKLDAMHEQRSRR